MLATTLLAMTLSLSGEWKFAHDWSKNSDWTPVAGDFDDRGWETVRVPHDWGIRRFYPDGWGAAGKLDWWGLCWYRKTFDVPDPEAAAVYLAFDGVMAEPQVYVNGEKAGSWDYGYMSFRLDVTGLVKKDAANVVAVRADTRSIGTRWYPGAGLYRDVRVVTRRKGEAVPGSVFVRVEKLAPVEQASPPAHPHPSQATLCASWDVVGGGHEEKTFVVDNPHLWSVTDPYLYTFDAPGEKVRYGIRTAEWTADDGFHLNGKRLQLHGVNLHADLGPLGMAFNESAARRQLRIMKSMGVNAIRTAHNPADPKFLDLCDEMGFVVWADAFDKWDATAHRPKDSNLEEYVTRNLAAMVRRDRNHPAIVTWSIFNEILNGAEPAPGDKVDPDGLTRARIRRFKKTIKDLDPTRAVGAANTAYRAAYVGLDLQADLDVQGWNYFHSYTAMRKRNPKMPLVYTEAASSVATFGDYYHAKDVKDFCRARLSCDGYDRTTNCNLPIEELNFEDEDKYLAGEFIWSGIDYLGEPVPFEKESRSSYFGACTLQGYPKDRYYLYRSIWAPEKKTIHILPHWNWADESGRAVAPRPPDSNLIVPVYVYSNGDTAELFLNGKSLGTRTKGMKPQEAGVYGLFEKYAFRWLDVKYAPGELKVRVWKGGKLLGEETMRTAGAPAAVKLTPEAKTLNPNGTDVEFVRIDVTDAKGTRCPLEKSDVKLELSGPGEIVAVSNASEHDYQSFLETDHVKLFNGMACVTLRRRAGTSAPVKLTARIEGLKEATVVFDGAEVRGGKSASATGADAITCSGGGTLASASSTKHPWPKVIFPGDFPDPSIIRDGEDYYMTFSGLEYRPGLVIYHSRDLLHWQPVASAAEEIPGSVWAPDIAAFKGAFSIYVPADGIRGVSAASMRGPWSAPFALGAKGIDPGILTTPTGERWLWINNGNAGRLDPSGKNLIGEQHHFYDGWRFPLDWKTENSSQQLYLESPKLFKRGDYYYLVSAEGGTAGPATSHMAAVARARRPEGPWENSPYNPLIHTWSADEEWWSTGHATVFADARGDWWAVYHGYRKGALTLGRSTLLAPVTWTDDGWPLLDLSDARKPLPASGSATIGGDYADDFTGDKLALRWGLFGNGQLKYARVKDDALELEASGWGAHWGTIAAFVPSMPRYSASVDVETPEGAEAGLVLVYDRHNLVGVTTDGKDFILYTPDGKDSRVKSTFGTKVRFHVENRDEKVSFFAVATAGESGGRGATPRIEPASQLASLGGYALPATRELKLLDNIDVSAMDHNHLGGFMSLRIGLSCSDKGKKALFRHFRYKNEKSPWRDPTVSAINRLDARAIMVPCATREQAVAIAKGDAPRTDSPYLASLNGTWDFKWKHTVEADWEKTGKIAVPGCWQLQGDYDPTLYTNSRYPIAWNEEGDPMVEPPKDYTSFYYRNPVGRYTRTFTIPTDWKGRRVVLHFGGVSSAMYVRVNGQLVGYSEDSRLPAEFDITSSLIPHPSSLIPHPSSLIPHPSSLNTLEVEVLKHCDGTYLEDQDFWRLSGIFRDVWLVAEAKDAPKDLVLTTRLSDDYARARATVLDEKGEVVYTREVEHPKLWNVEAPNLYYEAFQAGGDWFCLPVGFRKIEIRDAVVYVNGKRLLVKGVNRHEMSPETGYTVSEALMKRDLEIIRDLGINAVRTCHYPDDPTWYELCDRAGIGLVSEANVEAHGVPGIFEHGRYDLPKNPRFHDAIVERNVNMVKVFRNHPAVLFWSMGNESGDGPAFADAYTAIKAIDATRPVQYEGAKETDHSDIMCPMYWDQRGSANWTKGHPKKPFILCEYAHAMGNASGDFNEYWKIADRNPSFQGGFIWDFADQALLRKGTFAYGGDFGDRPNDGNFNCNGLVAADRSYHPGAYEVKAVHAGRRDPSPVPGVVGSRVPRDRLMTRPSSFHPRLDFWRATTDNDKGWNMWNVCKVWREATETQVPPEGVTANLDVADISERETLVTLDVDIAATNLPPVPRIGVTFTIPKEFRTVTWEGRGPYENYADRKVASDYGTYTLPLEKFNPMNYVNPGEQGHRSDCRKVTFAAPDGRTLTIESVDGLFGFNAWPFSEESLEKARHIGDLKEEGAITVVIDEAMMGVAGVNSWGGRPYAHAMIAPGRHHLGVRITR